MTLDTLRERIKNELVLQNGNVFVQAASELGLSDTNFLALINEINRGLPTNLGDTKTLKTETRTQIPPKPKTDKPVSQHKWKTPLIVFVVAGLVLWMVWLVYEKMKVEEKPNTPIKLPPIISPVPAVPVPEVLRKPTPPKTVSPRHFLPKHIPKPISRFDEVGLDPYESGLRPARKNQQWGYINANNKWIIEPQYKHAKPFRKDRAHVFDAGCDCWLFIDQDGKPQR
jgi:hypothetical protein